MSSISGSSHENRVCRTRFHLNWNRALQTRFLIHALSITLRLSLTTFYLETQKSRRTKPKPRRIKPKHLETLKPKQKATTFYLETQKSRRTKPKPQRQKETYQRGGNSERVSGDWTQVAKAPGRDDGVCWWFLSGSLDGFLDSCSWFSLVLWVRDSWCLLGLLRELVSCFLMFLSWCCQLTWQSERQSEWETERVWLRNWVCKARFQFKWNRVQLTRFQHSKIESVAFEMLVS